MTKFVNGEEVKEGKKVSLIANVFTLGGETVEVTEGAALGNDTLTGGEGMYVGVSGYRPGSRLPVTLDIQSLGHLTTVTIKKKTTHPVDVKFDALAFLDEQEKLAALTESEKERLSNIGILELRALGAAAGGHVWTPFEDAVVAILSHDKGATYGEVVYLPQPGVEYDTEVVPGPVAGTVIELAVGDHVFNEKSDGFIAAISACNDGRTLYQYSWTGVPVTVLNEKE